MIALSGSNYPCFNGTKDVRAIEVRLYFHADNEDSDEVPKCEGRCESSLSAHIRRRVFSVAAKIFTEICLTCTLGRSLRNFLAPVFWSNRLDRLRK